MSMNQISATDLMTIISSDEEIAIVDIREKGHFGLEHLLHAANIPFSELESGILLQVPRRTTRIVLIDGIDRVAPRAEERLRELGYVSVECLAGGVDAWRDAGGEVFIGEDVTPKAFGEIVEEELHTPALNPREVAALIGKGEDVIILDGRTWPEHQGISIPGSISVPNGELLLRLPDLVKDPRTNVVVTCAGRTRSIIGAQTLINAGVENPVYALRGGTQAWRMAGLSLQSGSTNRFADVTPEGAARAEAFANDLRRKAGIPDIPHADVERIAGKGQRSVYLLDVRTREEFDEGHIAGSVHAPGGQLVQGVIRWCAVRRGLLVLIDSAPFVRAVSAAHWLRQMGYDARVLDGGVEGATSQVVKDDPPLAIPPFSSVALVDTDHARRLRTGNVLTIDVGSSMDYRNSHIAGAIWGIRPRLDDLCELVHQADTVIVYSAVAARAFLFAADLKRLFPAYDVCVLNGGLNAWRVAGGEVESTPDAPPDEACIDYLFWAHDRQKGNDAATLQYFNWEHGLPEQITRDGTSEFRILK
ncbi:rhodanese-like domain-containing protein [Chelatococcus sp. HY11]|uniref:rhodanese-like domain-containing protein n=2 Tax=unclassified Chelatococcus TaxID=2638111 RepID=UPI001BCFD1B5|nr:rhodanese-like domain-containing protein [Chelatococcus sp. HY11]MBS7740255.1 sulfurtransferase [Chelatococcus sp. HY11]